jgi:hypothetical protein
MLYYRTSKFLAGPPLVVYDSIKDESISGLQRNFHKCKKIHSKNNAISDHSAA